MRFRVPALSLLLLSSLALSAADWPQFLGPNRNGSTPETGFRTDWRTNPPQPVWKKRVGIGASSVVVVNGLLYTQGNNNDTNIITCLNASTGDQVWTYAYPSDKDRRNFEGGTAATPAVSLGRVVATGQHGEVVCLESLTGRHLWTVNLETDLGGQPVKWKYAASPLILGNKVIVEPGAKDGAVAALNLETGELLWKAGSDEPAYASSIPYPGGIASLTRRSFMGIDPADGRVLFNYERTTSFGVNATTPIHVGGKFLLSSCYGKDAVLLDVSSGQPKEIWSTGELSTQFQNLIYHDGAVFAVDGWEIRKASLKCLDFETGKLLWEREMPGRRGTMTLADGKLILMSEKGELLLLKASREKYVELGRTQVLGGTCWSLPVLCNGLIYVRNVEGTLLCLEVR